MATAEPVAIALGGRKADGDNGKVLIRCRAGCDQPRVIAALHSRGLWDENDDRHLAHHAARAGANTRQSCAEAKSAASVSEDVHWP
jgi:hypothetical protein